MEADDIQCVDCLLTKVLLELILQLGKACLWTDESRTITFIVTSVCTHKVHYLGQCLKDVYKDERGWGDAAQKYGTLPISVGGEAANLPCYLVLQLHKASSFPQHCSEFSATDSLECLHSEH